MQRRRLRQGQRHKARISLVKKEKIIKKSVHFCRFAQNSNVKSPNFRFWRQREHLTINHWSSIFTLKPFVVIQLQDSSPILYKVNKSLAKRLQHFNATSCVRLATLLRYVACVWPVRSTHVATSCSKVARCCVEMLRAFGQALRRNNREILAIALSYILKRRFRCRCRCYCKIQYEKIEFVSPSGHVMFCLTNRFHVAVRLFSNRSQMTSKCGKNKKVAHEAIAECVTDVLTTFWRLLWSITEQTHGNMESICFI